MYGEFHWNDKTVVKMSHPYNGNPYTGELNIETAPVLLLNTGVKDINTYLLPTPILPQMFLKSLIIFKGYGTRIHLLGEGSLASTCNYYLVLHDGLGSRWYFGLIDDVIVTKVVGDLETRRWNRILKMTDKHSPNYSLLFSFTSSWYLKNWYNYDHSSAKVAW